MLTYEHIVVTPVALLVLFILLAVLVIFAVRWGDRSANFTRDLENAIRQIAHIRLKDGPRRRWGNYTFIIENTEDGYSGPVKFSPRFGKIKIKRTGSGSYVFRSSVKRPTARRPIDITILEQILTRVHDDQLSIMGSSSAIDINERFDTHPSLDKEERPATGGSSALGAANPLVTGNS